MGLEYLRRTYEIEYGFTVYEYWLKDMSCLGFDDVSIFIAYNVKCQMMFEYLKFGKDQKPIYVGVLFVSEQELFPTIGRLLDLDFNSLLPIPD